MYNHAPQNYTCPICLAVKGIESDETMMKQDDIFYRDDLVMAAINSKFIESNPGHAIVVPVQHYENIYDVPEKVAAQIMKISKEVAIAMKKVRKCDGVMVNQNNEPASGQHALHYHMHIIPRFTDDGYGEDKSTARVSDPEERKPFSAAMKKYFETYRQ